MLKRERGAVLRIAVALAIYQTSGVIMKVIDRYGSQEDEDLYNRYAHIRWDLRQRVYERLEELFHR